MLGIARLGRGSWRLGALTVSLCIGLAFGIFEIGRPVETTMMMMRNKLRTHAVSGTIVLVAIDDRSLAEIGPLPWRSERLRTLVRRLHDAGARRIYLDVDLPEDEGRRGPGDAPYPLRAIGERLLLPARFSVDPVSGVHTDHQPPAGLLDRARAVNTNLWVSGEGDIWLQPYSAVVAGRTIPSLAAILGNAGPGTGGLFPIDYALDMRSVPMLSASDVLAGRFQPARVAGMDVAIARTDSAVEHLRAPGVGLVPGIMFHIMAAETLLSGTPVRVGWLLPLALACLAAAALLWAGRRSLSVLVFAAAAILLVIAPAFLEHHHVFAEVLPPLALLGTAGAIRLGRSLRRSYILRGTTNTGSGMPNLHALRQARVPAEIMVVAARINNYTKITTALAPQDEKELVRQIVARLSVGTGAGTVYQADEGIFIWIAEGPSEEELVCQLEGLHALFRSPVIVASRLIDLAITFGLDLDGSRPVMQRVSSALVAADEAAAAGKRYRRFNPATLDDADWTLSLLGRLDLALEAGELWVAYQPKFDCATGWMIGAEALVRWRHPEKGEIYPGQFIGAAEKGGRIEPLTRFVLDTALAAAAAINAGGRRFTMAVNLSASLLDQDDIVPFVDALLKTHGVAPDLLVLEVTETSMLGGAMNVITNLERLSALGVILSIDDYGTGFSTLEYLKRVPASEIKIDRSFVSMLDTSQSDRIMVNSTIQLAHSLGRTVVAEGVESEAILNELRRMRCDVVQGYHTGRPMPLANLLSSLAVRGKLKAA